MKKLTYLLTALIITVTTTAQNIKDIQAYSKFGTTRILALLEDNSAWFYTTDAGWSALPTNELPEGNVKYLDVYHKLAKTDLMAVMEDNSVWWSVDEKWEKLSSKGLPSNYSIKAFKPYTEVGYYSAKTRVLLLLEDNSIYDYSKKTGWEKLSSKGIPEVRKIKLISTYQKYNMMGKAETRYIIILDDNTLMWFGEKSKNWEKLSSSGLPSKANINHMQAYIKFKSMGSPDGRIVAVLDDQSMHYTSTKDVSWESVDTKDLPAAHEIKSLKAFQKSNGLTMSTRLIVLLNDGSMWWHSDGDWTQITTDGLGK